jgi:hypothetical protein
MTTQTKPRFNLRTLLTQLYQTILAIFKRKDTQTQMKDAVLDMGRDFEYIGNVITWMLFFMVFTAFLAMGTAYLLAFPNGLAGWIASLAVASGMPLENFMPAFGFSLVLLNGFLIFFILMVASWTKWQGEQDDDQTYDLDTVAGMIIELQDKVEELARKAE